MPRYAADTQVGRDRSQAEIERTLRRYGGDDVVIGSSARMQSAFVQFVIRDVPVRLTVPLPDPESPEFGETATGRKRRNPGAALKAWEQACRQRWRALLLLLKAQLESVELEIVTVDQAFMPWIVMPNGKSVGEYMLPQIAAAREAGTALKALPWPGQREGEPA